MVKTLYEKTLSLLILFMLLFSVGIMAQDSETDNDPVDGDETFGQCSFCGGDVNSCDCYSNDCIPCFYDCGACDVDCGGDCALTCPHGCEVHFCEGECEPDEDDDDDDELEEIPYSCPLCDDPNCYGGCEDEEEDCDETDPNGDCYVVPESTVPCEGDPVKDPQIAPQTNSGIGGGRYGNTRSEGKQGHWGLDIKSEFGDPIYAMFDGHASSVSKFYTKAGWIVYQTAVVNGESVSIQYFHMQEDSRFTGNVKAGDIIGYQGDSGNLGRAIDQGLSESHLHIKMKDSNGNTVNPEDYLKTTFDSEGNPTNNCN